VVATTLRLPQYYLSDRRRNSALAPGNTRADLGKVGHRGNPLHGFLQKKILPSTKSSSFEMRVNCIQEA
jgi:hypothetical protein